MLNKLKSEKGITLISLIVYVIVMLIVITIVGTITSYFYANVNNQYEEINNENEKATLDMYLANDLKNKDIIISFVNSDSNTQVKLEYNNGSYIIYTIASDGIYRDKVRIYSGDTSGMEFRVTNISSGVIQEKLLFEIIKDNNTFKSYTINKETKAVYE